MELIWAEQYHSSGRTRLWGLFGSFICGKSGLLHCRIPKTQITFLGANSLFPVKNVLSVWDTCRKRLHGSKPIFFSHTGLTTEWVLHRPAAFLNST